MASLDIVKLRKEEIESLDRQIADYKDAIVKAKALRKINIKKLNRLAANE